MAARMPVLGQDHVAEARGQAVDDRHDLVAARHGERAARAEIVLDVDDEQDVLLADRSLSVMAAPPVLRQPAVGLARRAASAPRRLRPGRRARVRARAAAPAGAASSRAACARISASVGDGARRRPAAHHRVDQRLAGLRVVLDREHVAGHAAVGP